MASLRPVGQISFEVIKRGSQSSAIRTVEAQTPWNNPNEITYFSQPIINSPTAPRLEGPQKVSVFKAEPTTVVQYSQSNVQLYKEGKINQLQLAASGKKATKYSLFPSTVKKGGVVTSEIQIIGKTKSGIPVARSIQYGFRG